jgi:hypothetical protein
MFLVNTPLLVTLVKYLHSSFLCAEIKHREANNAPTGLPYMLLRVIAFLLLIVMTATVVVTQNSWKQKIVSEAEISIVQSLPHNRQAITTDRNFAGLALPPADRTRITEILKSKNIIAASPFTPPTQPRFILHDTGVDLNSKNLENHQKEARGPLGIGVSAFMPREGAALVTRPDFYERGRPTTTEFEKAADVLGRGQRESLFRQIWRSAPEDTRKQALDRVLSDKNLQPNEIEAEQKTATAQLDGSGGKVFTTAVWTVEEICKVSQNGADLKAPCEEVQKYFDRRNQRVSSSVPIEIVQPGGQGSSCSVGSAGAIPFKNPPYSVDQYDNVMLQYLRATLIAGKYPEATTHFALDHGLPDSHCDPRCFNMNKLYRSIAMELRHPPDSSYGIEPSYGTKSGTNSVWWDDRFCYSQPPQ